MIYDAFILTLEVCGLLAALGVSGLIAAAIGFVMDGGNWKEFFKENW